LRRAASTAVNTRLERSLLRSEVAAEDEPGGRAGGHQPNGVDPPSEERHQRASGQEAGGDADNGVAAQETT